MVNEEHLFGFGLFALLGVSFLKVFACLLVGFFLISLMFYVEHLPLTVPLNVTFLLRGSLGHLQPLHIVSNLQPLTADGC